MLDLGQDRMTPGESSRIDFNCTQIVTYMWRLRDKDDPLKEANKSRFYIDRLIVDFGNNYSGKFLMNFEC